MKRFIPLPSALGVLLLFAVSLLINCNFGTAPGGTEGEGLTGILVDNRGVPVVNVRVRAYPDTSAALAKRSASEPLVADSVTTNGEGRFNFTHLANGRYNIAASLTRGDTMLSVYLRGVAYEGGREDLGSTVLLVSGSLTLRIQLGDNTGGGATLDSVICRVPSSPFQGVVSDSGVCVIKGLPPGSFQVEISRPGYHVVLSDLLTVVQNILSNGGLIELIDNSEPNTPADQHFPVTPSTVALWAFNAYASGSGNHIEDLGPHAFALTASSRVQLQASPKDSAAVFSGDGKYFSVANNPLFTVAGTGRTTLEARVFMTVYPPSANQNGSSEIIGMYEGPRMLVRSDGTLYVSMQKQNAGGSPYWYSAITRPAAIPLGKWTDIALAFDTTVSPKQIYAYIDGIPVQLYYAVDPGGRFVIAAGDLIIGNDKTDALSFNGKVDEVRISNNLALGPGLPLINQSDSITSGITPLKTQISVVSSADLCISSSTPGYPDVNNLSNKNRGSETAFGPGTYDVYSTSRSLVRFTLPAGYTRTNITRAVIRVTNRGWVTKNVSSPFRIDLHRVLKSWKEGTGTLTDNSASIDGATALERFWGSQNGAEDWTQKFAGLNDTDASAIPVATVTKSPGTAGSWDFDVTELAKAWADDTSKNFGVLMASPFPATNGEVQSYPEFNTREAGVADSLKPLLILNGPP